MILWWSKQIMIKFKTVYKSVLKELQHSYKQNTFLMEHLFIFSHCLKKIVTILFDVCCSVMNWIYISILVLNNNIIRYYFLNRGHPLASCRWCTMCSLLVLSSLSSCQRIKKTVHHLVWKVLQPNCQGRHQGTCRH